MSKDTNINIRISPEERESIKKLADDYGYKSVSEFIRLVIRHIDETRPELKISIKPRKQR